MRQFNIKNVVIAAAVGVLSLSQAAPTARAATTLIYGFNDASLNGFAGNGATPSLSGTTGVTEGAGALEISNKSTQTYGGALTSTVPSNFYNATSFNVDVTVTTTPVAGTPPKPVFFDLVPVFYSTDGEIDPDTSNSANYINLGGVAPGTYTYTVNLQGFIDPDGVLSTDATPGQILAADRASDPADVINGFELTVEHGSGTATTLYVDNLTVAASAVPEPASLSLLGFGALGLLRRRSRRVAAI